MGNMEKIKSNVANGVQAISKTINSFDNPTPNTLPQDPA